jgi:hypothetical protein
MGRYGGAKTLVHWAYIGLMPNNRLQRTVRKRPAAEPERYASFRGRSGWLPGREFGILRGRHFARGQTGIPGDGNEFPRLCSLDSARRSPTRKGRACGRSGEGSAVVRWWMSIVAARAI